MRKGYICRNECYEKFPPLHSNEENIEGLGLWKEEVQALQKALKSQLSLDLALKLSYVSRNNDLKVG